MNADMHMTFRPLQRADYPMFARWLRQPHVARWWRTPGTVEFVEEEYQEEANTAVFVVEGNGRPIGIIQCYRVEDYPEHFESVRMARGVGVDLLIGEPDLVGKGHGTQLLREFIDRIVRVNYPDASGVVADPEVGNLASVRAFEKAGFLKGEIVPGEDAPEQLLILWF